ncbi:MAG: ankyrin repeat domain-containing protein [Simkaniaceae bacterium]
MNINFSLNNNNNFNVEDVAFSINNLSNYCIGKLIIDIVEKLNITIKVCEGNEILAEKIDDQTYNLKISSDPIFYIHKEEKSLAFYQFPRELILAKSILKILERIIPSKIDVPTIEKGLMEEMELPSKDWFEDIFRAKGNLEMAPCEIQLLRDRNGNLLLHTAIEKDKFEIAKILIEMNTDINARNHKDHTPLMVAINYNRYAFFQPLIQAGANYNFIIKKKIGLKESLFPSFKNYVYFLLKSESNADCKKLLSVYNLIQSFGTI